MAEQRVRGLSLRRKVTGWLGAILAVTLVSIGMATAVGRWTSTAFDAMLADNSACYTVQDALAAETKAFSRMVREPSRENTEEYQTACEITEASLAELPFDYMLKIERMVRDKVAITGEENFMLLRQMFSSDDFEYIVHHPEFRASYVWELIAFAWLRAEKEEQKPSEPVFKTEDEVKIEETKARSAKK